MNVNFSEIMISVTKYFEIVLSMTNKMMKMMSNTIVLNTELLMQ